MRHVRQKPSRAVLAVVEVGVATGVGAAAADMEVVVAVAVAVVAAANRGNAVAEGTGIVETAEIVFAVEETPAERRFIFREPGRILRSGFF